VRYCTAGRRFGIAAVQGCVLMRRILIAHLTGSSLLTRCFQRLCKAEKDTPCTGHEPNVCIYASNRILYMPCPRRNHRIRRQSISAPSIPVRPKIKETKINNQRTIQSTYTCFQAVEDNTASPRRNRHDPNHHLRDHSDSLHQLLHLTLVFHMPEKPGSSVRVPA